MVELTQKETIVFGATGGTGLECVKQCLDKGIQVTAYVRRPEKLGDLQGRQGLTIVKGDIRDAGQVKELLASRFDHILLSLGGNGIWSLDDTCSAGTRNIINALKDVENKPRIILCSSMGVSESKPDVNCFIRWMLKYPLADKDIQEADLRASGLPLVIVRPARLLDLPPRGLTNVKAWESGAAPVNMISRADTAAFMIAQMKSNVWLGKAASLSWLVR